jgi:hypothetical protein
MLTLPFGHAYYKLDVNQFTTIRGKSYFKALKIGEQITANYKGKKFQTEIVNLELKPISEIPLEVLKLDAEYPDFVIASYQDFVELINTFRAGFMPKVTLESKMTIITLKKI